MTQHVKNLINELRDLGYHVEIKKVVLLDKVLGEIEDAKKEGKTFVDTEYYYESDVWDFRNVIRPELERRGYRIEITGYIVEDSPYVRIYF